MEKMFNDFMAKYADCKIALAVSGGVDSMVLMNLMAIGANHSPRRGESERSEGGGQITVLHVDHGLRPESHADARFVAESAATLGMPCEIMNWTGTKPTSGVEEAARDARYKLLTDFCHANGISVLLTAHQADDQIETFLMHLARGSGVYGLAGMRTESVRDGIRIVRPLLNVSRQTIEEYAAAHGIHHITDSMNTDEHYERVLIRQNRRLFGEKLGITDARIMLAIENLARARDTLEQIVNDKLAHVFYNAGRAMFSADFLNDMGAEVKCKFLSALLQKVGGNVYPLRLENINRAIISLSHDCTFTLGGCTVRRVGNKILIAPAGASTSFRIELN